MLGKNDMGLLDYLKEVGNKAKEFGKKVIIDNQSYVEGDEIENLSTSFDECEEKLSKEEQRELQLALKEAKVKGKEFSTKQEKSVKLDGIDGVERVETPRVRQTNKVQAREERVRTSRNDREREE